MDKETNIQINNRQIACRVLDIVAEILRFMVIHFMEYLKKHELFPTDRIYRGFDLSRVVFIIIIDSNLGYTKFFSFL